MSSAKPKVVRGLVKQKMGDFRMVLVKLKMFVNFLMHLKCSKKTRYMFEMADFKLSRLFLMDRGSTCFKFL